MIRRQALEINTFNKQNHQNTDTNRTVEYLVTFSVNEKAESPTKIIYANTFQLALQSYGVVIHGDIQTGPIDRSDEANYW